jgi:hypothetical protein
MSQSSTLSAMLANERVATLRAEAGRPLTREDRSSRLWDQRRREEHVPSSPAALLPLRWIPKST